MRRRRFLGLLGVGVGLATAGCSSGNSSETGTGTNPTPNRRAPPEYDCSVAGRPTLTGGSRARGDTVESRPYPDGPPPLGDEDAVVEYVTRYERALVQRRVRNDAPERVTAFGLSGGTRIYDAPADTALVRFRYTYWYEYEADGNRTVHADSPIHYATYYVDDSVVVRAKREGFLDDAEEAKLIPDPWESGEPVECFD
ncbi:hypothetical protein SAMN05216388_1002184 [Halorientalis persicus]|jgi:hypothetical protein|uniref:Uncharacterized protein n=1 Tax=Halorientalis persicus TaxID=1367881 RepID=A0A1H8F3A6_9EURY|nr:hypothetical protein [Halorientalis persicus]SEN26253.1 hypothetical protein SAMN05216388_1002184 [Halorientalis persicus]